MQSRGNRVLVKAYNQAGAKATTTGTGSGPNSDNWVRWRLKDKYYNPAELNRLFGSGGPLAGYKDVVIKADGTRYEKQEQNWVKQFGNELVTEYFDISSSETVTTTIEYSMKETDTMIASMSEVSIGINNQWTEGNGAGNLFSGAIDAAAQVAQNGVATGILNTLDGLGYGNNNVLKYLKQINQSHYRSSTQFMKAYAGTNISIPISITRTFVQDEYHIDISDTIAKIARWAIGSEESLVDYVSGSGQGNINQAIDSAKNQNVSGLPAAAQAAVNSFGGTFQTAPLGYLYDSENWKGMLMEAPPKIGGTIEVVFPNGVQIQDLVISDMSIQMSQTQVLTKFGLRPLTTTVSIQLIPARVWGQRDAMRILNFQNNNSPVTGWDKATPVTNTEVQNLK